MFDLRGEDFPERRGHTVSFLRLCAFAGLCSCADPDAAVDFRSKSAVGEVTTSAFLSQDGRQLVDDGGNWWRIKGANYNLIEFDTRRAPEPAQVEHLAHIGFNFIRFPINWSFLEPSPGNIDWSYVDQIEALVEMAAAQRLWVLVDMHQWNASPCFGNAIYGNGFPEWFVDAVLGESCSRYRNDPTKIGVGKFWDNFWTNPTLPSSAGTYAGVPAWVAFADAWRVVAWRLRNHDNVVGWDILNEPARGPRTPETALNGEILPAFYASVGARIRWSDWRDTDFRNHVLFFEGQDGDVKPSLSKPPLTNTALSPHLYSAESGWSDCLQLSSLAHRGLDKGAAFGIPVVFGEFGAEYVGPATAARGDVFAAIVSRIISVNGQSWAWWEFGPRDRDDTMALVDSALHDRPTVTQLASNLLIYSGVECE